MIGWEKFGAIEVLNEIGIGRILQGIEKYYGFPHKN
jgi:hypothetical protein